MKQLRVRLIWLVLLTLSALAEPASAQLAPYLFPSQSLLMTSTSSAPVQVGSADASAVAFSLSGTWTGTVSFQGSSDSVTWVTISTTTANGTTIIPTAGYYGVRAKVSTAGSGTATVIAFKSAAPIAGTSGGGGGSVTQGTSPWVDNITQWAGTAVGAATAWGTAPSGSVPGVNANVLSSVLPVGTANTATAQAAMSTTATQIVAARTGAAGTGRVAVTVSVPTTCGTLFVNATSSVTSSTGFPITAGSALTLNTTSALYGILASGTCTVSEVETY